MSKELNLVIAGLAGQGIVMVGKVLSTALLADGNKVSISDEIAISHRNSPTLTEIRVGEDIFSLNIPEGEADLIIAFEAMEGLKTALRYAKDDALVIINGQLSEQGARSDGARTEDADAAAEALRQLERGGIKNVKFFNGSEVAHKEVGRFLTLNMVMLGATVATGMVPVQPGTVENVIKTLSPKGAVEANLRAFKAGSARFEEQSKKEKVPARR